jgi:hypothetical protein
LVDESILFEVKSGPFDPSVAKEFAPWAPEEGTLESKEYAEQLFWHARKLLDISIEC